MKSNQPETPFAVIHVPHASIGIPTAVRDQFVLSDEDLQREIRVMTDHLTDVLFDVPGVETIRFPVSSLVLDPERFESDAHEIMAGMGMGVVYTHTSEMSPLRRAFSSDERARLIGDYYRPHHAALERAVAKALERAGKCLLIDAHSFPSVPLPYELDQDLRRPDICIGTDAFHTSEALRDLAVSASREVGWSVEIDRPFSGALIPMAFYRSDDRVSAIMIEVNRRLYLDEDSGAAAPGFDDCRARLSSILNALIAEYRCHTPSR
jgi:N-formylglutamate deformylase